MTNNNGYSGATSSYTNSNINNTFCIGNPYNSIDDSINFFVGYSSIHIKGKLRRVNFGPFAWSSLMKKDAGLSLLLDFLLENKPQKRIKDTVLVYSNSDGKTTKENDKFIINSHITVYPSIFQKRSLETDGYDEIIPYDNILKEISLRERNMHKSKLYIEQNPLTSTFYDAQIGRELQLISTIRLILPKKKATWKFIEIFFSELYPFMPFLIQEYFTKDIIRIIGPPSSEDCEFDEINVENKLDLAIMGTLLIILRLSYLSLFQNSKDIKEEAKTNPELKEVAYLLSNLVRLCTMNVATSCFNQFQLFRKASFTVLQLAVFMRIYHNYAPEDGDGADGGDSQILNATLIQMATSLGLNRDPQVLGLFEDPKMNMLSRKIWYFLVMSDLNQAYTFGNPTTIELFHFDTKLPFYEEGGENTNNLEIDTIVNEHYSNFGKIYPLLKYILNLTLNIDGKVNVSHLCFKISELEAKIYDTFDGHDPLIFISNNNIHNFQLSLKLDFYLSMKAFFVSLLFHIYWYYDKKSTNTSYFYLKKLLALTSEIIPKYGNLLIKPNALCDMILTPRIETLTHKINIVILSCIIRVNFKLFTMKKSDHSTLKFDILSKLSLALVNCAEIIISLLSCISKRYYYAWRIAKQHVSLIRTIKHFGSNFYKDNELKGKELAFPSFSIPQLKELLEQCEKVNFSFERSTKSNCQIRNDSMQDSSSIKKNNGNGQGLNMNISDFQVTNFSNNFINDPELDKHWLQMLSMGAFDEIHTHDETLVEDLRMTKDLENSVQCHLDKVNLIKNTSSNGNMEIKNSTYMFANHEFGFSGFDIFDDNPFENILLSAEKDT